jgi:alkanesulfonate monooxygenase SsuD/methylene tetrahydromethanopterin reductase-like flavin-dependent oxidoreductase (luciferase family)
VTMVVTWSTDAERETAMRSARDQLAFYGSTPAYAPVLELHGLGELHAELNRMSKAGRWDEMAAVVPESFVHEIAVVGERDAIAARLVERMAGITDSVSLVNNRNPDPTNFADIVADLRSLG